MSILNMDSFINSEETVCICVCMFVLTSRFLGLVKIAWGFYFTTEAVVNFFSNRVLMVGNILGLAL